MNSRIVKRYPARRAWGASAASSLVSFDSKKMDSIKPILEADVSASSFAPIVGHDTAKEISSNIKATKRSDLKETVKDLFTQFKMLKLSRVISDEEYKSIKNSIISKTLDEFGIPCDLLFEEELKYLEEKQNVKMSIDDHLSNQVALCKNGCGIHNARQKALCDICRSEIGFTDPGASLYDLDHGGRTLHPLQEGFCFTCKQFNRFSYVNVCTSCNTESSLTILKDVKVLPTGSISCSICSRKSTVFAVFTQCKVSTLQYRSTIL